MRVYFVDRAPSEVHDICTQEMLVEALSTWCSALRLRGNYTRL